MAKGYKDDDFRSRIAEQTKGIIFLGTPHKGSRLTLCGKVLSLFGHFMGASTHLLDIIQPGSSVNSELHSSFLRDYDHRIMVCMFETLPESFWGYPLMHVSAQNL